jgi:pyruvate,water dikinase
MHVLTRHSSAEEIDRLAGGKGRHLHHLTGNGVDIPTWVVLGADVCQHFLDGQGITARIEAALSQANADDDVSRAATEIEQLILGAELDDGTAALVRQACHEVGPGLLAVRSSAPDEDGGTRSFAGQFRTFLGVRDSAEAAVRIKECWASAYSEGSLRYRLRSGDTLAVRGMAVVLQRLVVADRSGVVFTADPATGSNSRLVLAAAFGLGEGVVSGSVDADTVLVDRTDGQISMRSTGTKATRYVPDSESGGCKVVDVEAAMRDEPALTDEEVKAICDLALRIEETYDCPQDIEWAIAEDRLWILQSRPITALTRAVPPEGPVDQEQLWDNSNIIESYGDVTSQLTFTFASHVYHRVYREYCELLGVPRAQLREMERWLPTMLGYIHGRVYYNLLNWYKIVRLLPLYPVNRRIFELSLGVQESLDAETANGIRPFVLPGLRGRMTTARIKANFLRRYFFSSRSVRKFVRTFDTTIAPFDSTDYTTLPADEIYRRFQELESDFLSRWAPMVLLEAVIISSLGLLFGLTRRWLPGVPDWFYWAVASPGGELVSAEPARELTRLAHDARADQRLSQIILHTEPDRIRPTLAAEGHADFLHRIDDYVARFGYRSPNELKLEEPDLNENPSSLFLMLRGALQAQPADEDPIAGRAKREADVAAILRDRLNPLQRVVYGIVRRKARSTLRDRESVRFCRTRAFGLARRMFLGMGRDLARITAIENERDIFHLRLAELRGCFEGTVAHAELPQLVRLRQRAQATAGDLVAPSRFRTRGPVYWSGNLESAGFTAVGDVPSNGATVMRGLPSSPGLVEGEAKVTTVPTDVGDCVLITYRTDPGWVGALPSIRALVIERGSPLTHVAIVARELGIPTVVQVPGVTRAVRNGDLVRVNGTTGELTVLGR